MADSQIMGFGGGGLGWDNIYSGYRTAYGQSFKGLGYSLNSVKFELKKTGSPTGTIVAKLYAHSGTYGSSSVPTGSALATSGTIDVSTLTGTSTYYTFTFSSPYTCVLGTAYVVVVEYTGGDASNYVVISLVTQAPSDPGNMSYYASGAWTASSSIDVLVNGYTTTTFTGGPLYLADITLDIATIWGMPTSAPSSLEEGQGWTVDKKASPNYARLCPDTVLGSGSFSATEPTGDPLYYYQSGLRITGTFANSNWTLYFKVKCNNYYAQTGYVKMRLWKYSADYTMTQLTSGWVASSLISFTAANQYQTGSIAWSPGATKVLDNDLLLLEIEWSCSASGGNNSAAVYWVHNEGSTERLETPSFTEGGGISVTPGAATAKGQAVGPTVVLGSTTATPAPALATGVAVNPGVQNNVVLTPAFAVAVSAAVSPGVVHGSVLVTPVQAAALAQGVDPVVVLGSLLLLPALAAARAFGIDPTVTIGGGGESVSPAAAQVLAQAMNPQVVNNVLLAPAQAGARASGVNPAILANLYLTPAAAQARGLAVNPAVLNNTLVVPAIAQLLASGINPTVVLGALAILPALAQAVAQALNPQVQIGGLLVVPAPAQARALAADPFVDVPVPAAREHYDYRYDFNY